MLEALKSLPESQWPARPKLHRRKHDRDFERKVEELLKSRDHLAAELDLECSLLASRAAIESIAAGEADPHQVLLNWQMNVLGFNR